MADIKWTKSDDREFMPVESFKQIRDYLLQADCYVEGVNRKIKQIKRTAYGYKNWQNFIYRIQIEFKIKIEKRTQFVNELDSKYNFSNTG